jgi:transcription elongation factor Elf1
MHEMTPIKSRYRCPRCNSYNSVNVDKIFDGRLLFCCSKCNICALVPKDTDADGPDSAYLEFLDLYDNGRIANSVDLNTIMQQERILRPSSEIKAYSKKVTKEQRTSYSRRCYLLRRIMW